MMKLADGKALKREQSHTSLENWIASEEREVPDVELQTAKTFLQKTQELRKSLKARLVQQKKMTQALHGPTTQLITGIVRKSGPNFGRLYQLQQKDGEMVKGSFKWLDVELEECEEVTGHHREKGPYSELFLPSGERILGTREYHEEDDCCKTQ